ncbi:hypothetical protein Scep_027967 [Stephania cephalantha]|uniref:Uncharacterized protein n=1 Tax=Stephania cephalantha TaxID=152367 RepID=A0AAP0E8X6_9MAGN
MEAGRVWRSGSRRGFPEAKPKTKTTSFSEISSSFHLQITPINNNTTKMMTIGEISSTISRTRTTITISFPLTDSTDSTIYRLMDSSRWEKLRGAIPLSIFGDEEAEEVVVRWRSLVSVLVVMLGGTWSPSLGIA